MSGEPGRRTEQVPAVDGMGVMPPSASTPAIVPTITPTIPWAIGFLPLLCMGKGWGSTPSRQDKEAGR